MYRKVVISGDYLIDALSNGLSACMMGPEADRGSQEVLDHHLLSMDFMTDRISLDEYIVRMEQLNDAEYDENKQ